MSILLFYKIYFIEPFYIENKIQLLQQMAQQLLAAVMSKIRRAGWGE